MILMSAHSGRSGGVPCCHDCPPSRERWTSPSSEPAQKTPASWGDSRKAKIVQYTSAPELSAVIGPPEEPSLLGSLRVKSGLITCQLAPSSAERCTTFEHA